MPEPRPSTKEKKVNESELPKLDFSFSDIPWEEKSVSRDDENASTIQNYTADVAVVVGDQPLHLECEHTLTTKDVTGQYKDSYLFRLFENGKNDRKKDAHILMEIYADVAKYNGASSDETNEARTGVYKENGDDDTKTLPQGIGTALYIKLLDELLPILAKESHEDLTHVIQRTPYMSYTQWTNIFGPIMRKRGYVEMDSTHYEKVYRENEEEIHAE